MMRLEDAIFSQFCIGSKSNYECRAKAAKEAKGKVLTPSPTSGPSRETFLQVFGIASARWAKSWARQRRRICWTRSSASSTSGSELVTVGREEMEVEVAAYCSIRMRLRHLRVCHRRG